MLNFSAPNVNRLRYPEMMYSAQLSREQVDDIYSMGAGVLSKLLKMPNAYCVPESISTPSAGTHKKVTRYGRKSHKLKPTVPALNTVHLLL